MNLIALKQLRQDLLSGFISLVASGDYTPIISSLSGVLQSQIDALESGRASGVSRTIPSGANEMYLNYNTSFTNAPVAVFNVQSQNISAGHLIESYLVTGYPTGAYLIFSNTIPTTGYQIHGLLTY